MLLQHLVAVDLRNIDSGSKIYFARLESLRLSIQVAHNFEVDLFQLNFVFFIVIFVLAQRNGVLDIYAGDVERTIGNDRIFFRSVLCPFRLRYIAAYLRLLDRIEYGICQHGSEVRR